MRHPDDQVASGALLGGVNTDRAIFMTTSLQTQIGGSHYSSMAIQPVEFITKNGLTYLEGNVVKYLSRHRRKNGKEDLLKARHYLEMLIETEYPEAKQ